MTDEEFVKKFDAGSLTSDDVHWFFLDRHTDPKLCVLRICEEPDVSMCGGYADRYFSAIFKCGNRYFSIYGSEDFTNGQYYLNQNVTEVYPHKKMITVYTTSPEKEKHRKIRPGTPEERFVPYYDPDLNWKN